jgi:hypothetical protein
VVGLHSAVEEAACEMAHPRLCLNVLMMLQREERKLKEIDPFLVVASVHRVCPIPYL